MEDGVLKRINSREAELIMQKYDSSKGFRGGLTYEEIFQLGKYDIVKLADSHTDLCDYYMYEVSDMF